MRAACTTWCCALLGCAPGPRYLEDDQADLDVPVTVWMEDVGQVEFDGGLEDRRMLSSSMMLVPGTVACERDATIPFMSFSLRHTQMERAVNDADDANLGLVFEEDWARATRGWVRIDRSTDDSVRGALSWVSEDEEGETVAWGEGAFDLRVCDWQ